MCVFAILVAAYMGFAMTLSTRMAAADTLTGMEVTLSDPMSRFVSVRDVVIESGIDPTRSRAAAARLSTSARLKSACSPPTSFRTPTPTSSPTATATTTASRPTYLPKTPTR